jgi:hypothetical protein
VVFTRYRRKSAKRRRLAKISFSCGERPPGVCRRPRKMQAVKRGGLSRFGKIFRGGKLGFRAVITTLPLRAIRIAGRLKV